MTTTIRPRAFAVMPFGVKEARAAVEAKGGEPAQPAVQVDFDLVYEQLIAPALTRAGCAPFRADEEEVAGDIRTDMFYELVTADIVLADVSSSNGNVFYELGVRHAAGPSGVFMIYGGWAKRIFDLAPDRTFAYDGELFAVGHGERDDAWKAAVAAEAERLGGELEAALEADARTVGSPVYKEMPGLKAVDWSGVRTARSKYFGDVFADWRQRVDVAKENGWPGDILTLADEAPTRFHHKKLLWHAADALCSMERFEAALPVLQQLVSLDPDHRDAQTRLGLVLGRTGRIAEAKAHMLAMVEKFQHDGEGYAILGRVFKDLWRLEWKDEPTLEGRQQGAVAASSFIASAVKSYDEAVRRRLDYFTGVNVVSLVRLLEHLQAATGEPPADHGVEDVDTLSAVVRFAATNALAAAGLALGQDGVWAAATLGELELGTGNAAAAAKLFRDAAHAPATTYFNVSSMLGQVELFEELGFQPGAVAAVKKVLATRRAALEKRVRGLKASAPRFGKVVVSSGHMIDAPGRPQERFPPRKEQAVRERMAAQLAEWGVGPGDLAICGGARGADLLFAELCSQRGAEVWVLLALPENEFLEESVRLPESDWEERYFRLREQPGTKVFLQPDRLKSPPKGASVFARTNLWMLNTARVEAPGADKLYALLVWDRKPTGDGPGGTSDFVARVKTLGGRRGYVNPLEID